MIVGMYFFFLFNRKFFDYFSWMSLVYGIFIVEHVREYGKFIPWERSARKKSIVLYGVLFLFFFYMILDTFS